jgi:acyl carrier protein
MNAIRQDIKSIWCNILGIEDCAQEANFFDLGGNSLQIIKLINLLDEKHGLDIEIEDIFDDMTLNNLTNVALNSASKKSVIN